MRGTKMSNDEDQSTDEPQFDWRAFTPDDSPMTPMDMMADPKAIDLSNAKLARGDQAYFFTSPVYDFSTGQQVSTGRSFDLRSACREQPVALIFGSYT